MEISQRIFEIMKQNKQKQKDLADATNISTSAISAWKKNGTSPAAETLFAIADFLGVSLDYLLTGKESTLRLTEDEHDLLSLYGKLSSVEQQRLIGRAELLAEQAEERAREKEKVKRLEIQQSTTDESTLCETIDIPFSTLLVSAGLGDDLLAQDGTQETISVPATPTTRRANFAVRVNGDSMEPMYSDGDIVLVEQDQDVPEGQVGIFAVNGRGYIKKAGRRRLISINDAYDDILISPDDSVKCFGLVIGKL